MSDPGRRSNPYPLYRSLRQRGPTYYAPLRAWLLTSYDDVSAALRNPFVSSMRSMQGLRAIDLPESRSSRFFSHNDELSMLNRDPPDHTRLRRLVSRAFSASAITKKRERVQSVAEGLLEAHLSSGSMDALADFAYPFPLIVVCELLGVPAGDADRFLTWSRQLSGRFGINPQRRPAARRLGNQAMAEVADYFLALAAQRRADPQPDLISGLVAVADEGDRLSEEELVANCILLLNAGHETTANLIGNGLFALLVHPEQLRGLKDHPEMIESAVEELLRFDTSIQLTPRTATADLDISGIRIPAGARLLLMLGAANHDPEHFAEPENLHLGRAENRHLAFGWGAHFCLGASLAREEIEISLRTLLSRCPNLRLDTESIRWRDHFSLRGLESLPVRWDPV